MTKRFRCWSFTLFIDNIITGENYDADCIDEQYEKNKDIVKYEAAPAEAAGAGKGRAGQGRVISFYMI